jgi:hypothetical protein
MRLISVYSFALLSWMFVACGPLGPLPGGEIDGALASTPAGDWSFTDAHWTVQLETRPGDPYSVNVWCAAAGGRLYVGAGRGGSSTWSRALLDNPRARVRIGTVLYEVTAIRVADDAEIETYLDALSLKYSSSDAELSDFQPSSDQPPSAVLFRLEPVSGDGAA